MNIPFFSFEYTTKSIKSQVLVAFEKFYDSEWYVLGDSTREFEQKYATFNQVNYCVGVSSGLDALHLALLSLNIGTGDEVIVPSNSYIATVLAVTYTGATPVFVEPRWETANINPDLIEAAITKKTKAIMPVHLYGQACEMDAIMKIAIDHDLYVVEDNAQAHGAMFKGRMTGSFGNINATSFYPTKNLGALGEAGAVTTNDGNLAEQVRILRNYGSHERYYNDVIGYNNRIDEFEATYLTIALQHLEQWNKKRSEIAALYLARLQQIPDIKTFEVTPGATTVNHLFVIKTGKRDALRASLAEQGIGTQIHYPVPPYLQKAYSRLGYRNGSFPIAEELARTVLSLPIWPGLSTSSVNSIVERLKKL